jgi:membrane protein DedA with SNARE-associated domain
MQVIYSCNINYANVFCRLRIDRIGARFGSPRHASVLAKRLGFLKKTRDNRKPSMTIDSILAAITDLIGTHGHLAPFIVGLLAFCESLAFLSLLVPATVLLVGIGALIAATGLDFWSIWLGAVIGAFLGDTVSYLIGRKFKYAAFKVWPMSRHPEMIGKGENFFSRWGMWGVFAGRFFGPLRAVIPLIAGIFAMPLVLFQIVNITSAMVWSFVMLAPGAGLIQAIK